MKPFDVEELDALLLDAQEGELSPEQRTELQDLLRSNSEARREFARLQLMDAAMHLMGAEEDLVETTGAPEPQPYLTVKTFFLGAIAACAIFGFGILFERIFLPGADGLPPSVVEVAKAPQAGTEPAPGSIADAVVDQTDRGVAILSQAIDVVWSDTVPPILGGSVNRGSLQFESGVIQLEFYRGARLIVEGPARLELVSANEVICHEGGLRAFVPPPARGFTVLSPTTELVDLGTEFAMRVGANGKSEVHVFDGLVELYPPDGERSEDARKELVAGSAVSVEGIGQMVDIAPDPTGYPTFGQVEQRSMEAARGRLESWRSQSKAIINNPRTLVHYDFEGDSRWLRGNKSVHSEYRGAIIGCDRVEGRWPDKGALEFKRSGDRVRIEVLGSFDALTLAAWVRVDAIKNTYQGLLLTDGFEVGGFHWQISNDGDIRFGVRLPDQVSDEGESVVNVADYSAGKVFDHSMMGVWMHVCAVYDRNEGSVRHFIDGKQVRRRPLEADLPLQIGTAEIGNWGAPLSMENHVIRNFNGRMDELTIWNGALPVDDIRRAYQQGRP